MQRDTPLAAAFFARYGSKLSAPQQEKLRNWYWSGVLGEYYGSATETKIARDVPQLIRWMEDGEEPRTVWDTYFQIDRLDPHIRNGGWEDVRDELDRPMPPEGDSVTIPTTRTPSKNGTASVAKMRCNGPR